MKTRRPNRSEKYQYKIKEVLVSKLRRNVRHFNNGGSSNDNLDVLDFLTLDNGTLHQQENQEYLMLREQLISHVRQIIDTQLTKKQGDILNLFMDGYTQMDICRALGINQQSSVHKSIYGNQHYQAYGSDTHGGSIRKLKKLVQENDLIQNILKQLQELDMAQLHPNHLPPVNIPSTHFECHRCHRYFHTRDLSNGMCGNCVEIESGFPAPESKEMKKSSVYYGFSKPQETTMETKECTQCHQIKPVTDFYAIKKTSTYHTKCKACWKLNYATKKENPMNNEPDQIKEAFLAGAPLETLSPVQAPQPVPEVKESSKLTPEVPKGTVAGWDSNDGEQLFHHYNFFRAKRDEHQAKVNEYQAKLNDLKSKIISKLD